MPSQQNGYDCGLYICAVAEALCKLAAQQQQQHDDVGVEEQERQALQSISPECISNLRVNLLRVIEELAKQEQQQ